jgi:hypothetical protein
MIRSGRSRIVVFNKRSIVTVSVARRITAFSAEHWISDVSSMMTRRCVVATSAM